MVALHNFILADSIFPTAEFTCEFEAEAFAFDDPIFASETVNWLSEAAKPALACTSCIR